MQAPRATLLQLGPQSPWLEAALARLGPVVRWFELDAAARGAWLAAHAAEARVVVTSGNVGCDNALLAALPALGLIAVNGVGLDRIDLDFARARGVRVARTSGVLAADVADLAVGLIIALLRGIAASDAFVRAGRWLEGERPLARSVSGRRFGIVGLGEIGLALAARLAAFGPVAYHGPRRKPVELAFHAELADLARASDVLVVCCPANAATRGLVDARVLEALGAEGYLVNVARGAVVDEPALIAALEAGRLAGAALDVFADEPRVPDALRASERVVLAPHIGSATVETRARMAEVVLENVAAFLKGARLPNAVE
ncbi:MAG: 2-hydroxyacid dehydrogenase [Steroidobacteraceae bacterium]